jgi:hypothetical protein
MDFRNSRKHDRAVSIRSFRIMSLCTVCILGLLFGFIGHAAAETPTAADNSPYDTELVFVAGLGMMDGTTCEVWPKRIDFANAQSSGAQALKEQLRGLASGRVEQLLGPTERELRRRGISGAQVFASRYRFDIRRLTPSNSLPTGKNQSEGRVVVAALDPITRIGFVLSRQWLCTEALAHADQCLVVEVDENELTIVNSPGHDTQPPHRVDDPTPYRVLMRAPLAPEPDLRRSELVLLAAPSVRIPLARPGERTIIDTHLIVAADEIDTGALLVVPARAPVDAARSWMGELGPIPAERTAFVVLAGASLAGSIELDTHAIDEVFVDPGVTAGAPEIGGVEVGANGSRTFVPLSRREAAYTARRGLRIHPADLLRWTRSDSSVATARPELWRNPQSPGDVRFKWDAWTTEFARIDLSARDACPLRKSETVPRLRRPGRSSLLTRRWREMDSNFRFRAKGATDLSVRFCLYP